MTYMLDNLRPGGLHPLC